MNLCIPTGQKAVITFSRRRKQLSFFAQGQARTKKSTRFCKIVVKRVLFFVRTCWPRPEVGDTSRLSSWLLAARLPLEKPWPRFLFSFWNLVRMCMFKEPQTWGGPFSMETDFRALYVDSGLNFSSLRRKNQFPNEVVHVFYKFSPPPSQLLR